MDAFEDLYCKATDTQVAVVKSAVKLEDEQQFLIAKKIQELTGAADRFLFLPGCSLRPRFPQLVCSI